MAAECLELSEALALDVEPLGHSVRSVGLQGDILGCCKASGMFLAPDGGFQSGFLAVFRPLKPLYFTLLIDII